jgi:hypothetical protein
VTRQAHGRPRRVWGSPRPSAGSCEAHRRALAPRHARSAIDLIEVPPIEDDVAIPERPSERLPDLRRLFRLAKTQFGLAGEVAATHRLDHSTPVGRRAAMMPAIIPHSCALAPSLVSLTR